MLPSHTRLLHTHMLSHLHFTRPDTAISMTWYAFEALSVTLYQRVPVHVTATMVLAPPLVLTPFGHHNTLCAPCHCCVVGGASYPVLCCTALWYMLCRWRSQGICRGAAAGHPGEVRGQVQGRQTQRSMCVSTFCCCCCHLVASSCLTYFVCYQLLPVPLAACL
jgi:hypothetical protein